MRDDLLAKDKKGNASVVEALDLTNLVKKCEAGVLDNPEDVLLAIRTAWHTTTSAAAAAASSGGASIKDKDKDLSLIHI